MKSIPGVSTHAQERLAQRHGEATREEWLAAVQSILDRRALYLGRNTHNGTERWAVQIGPHTCQVWWAPDKAVITTVLQNGMSSLGYRTRTGFLAGRHRGRKISGRGPYKRERAHYAEDAQ